MRFRNRILLAIWGVVFGLLVIFTFLLNSWVRGQVESRFTKDLRGNYSAVREVTTLQANQDLKACQIVAESPRLKAVVELGDWRTGFQLARELAEGIGSDLFIISDAAGRPIISLRRGGATDTSLTESITGFAKDGRTPGTFVCQAAGHVYQCAAYPLNVGNEAVGYLALCYEIGPDHLASLSGMTNSDVALVAGDTLFRSTLPAGEQQSLASWLRTEGKRHPDIPTVSGPEICTIAENGETFLAVFCRIATPGAPALSPISFLLMKRVDREVEAALDPVMDTFVVLSIILLAVTGVIGYLISLGITRPIASLVRGTSEVSRGNYDFPIAVRGGGEMKFLSIRFQEMSHSLKEKISQLADRNSDLEQALAQLRATQAELVKSERLAATGKLTAQLSHEINNPIHNVQSCLQTALRRIGPDSGDRELLEVALDEVQRLGKLTHQMLDVYRTSMVEELRVPTSLNDVIRDVLASSSQVLTTHGVAIQTNLQENLPFLLGNADKLKQVVLNLVINAKDAMAGGGRLEITTTGGDGKITLIVEDSGIGIPPEHIHRIFDAFFTTKGSVSGVGLGLSVTYGIVQQHGGTISVRSTPGDGTTFEIVFPAITNRKEERNDHTA